MQKNQKREKKEKNVRLGDGEDTFLLLLNELLSHSFHKPLDTLFVDTTNTFLDACFTSPF
jgi:hypothetical protein